MDSLKIRDFCLSDTSSLLELLYELGRPKPQNDHEKENFYQLIYNYDKDSDKRIFVAELDNDKIIGAVIILILPRLNQISPELYIPELIVAKNYQNQDIGKELIHSCIDLQRKENVIVSD